MAIFIGDVVIGATVIGGAVIGATVIGGSVIRATVIGDVVIGATVIGGAVIGATVIETDRQPKRRRPHRDGCQDERIGRTGSGERRGK